MFSMKYLPDIWWTLIMRVDDSTQRHPENKSYQFSHTLENLGWGCKISEEERKINNLNMHTLPVNQVSPSLWNSLLKYSQEGSVEWKDKTGYINVNLYSISQCSTWLVYFKLLEKNKSEQKRKLLRKDLRG